MVAFDTLVGRSKKARLSIPLSDDEDEKLETATSFSKRITHFKKSPPKKGPYIVCLQGACNKTLQLGRKSQSMASDDDDFIVPSDSDIETKSVKSSSSRFTSSSRRSSASEEDFFNDDDEGAVAKKGKSKSKPKTTSTGAGATGGSITFLTAAERREQDKKNEKKAAEDPYAFLADIRDVLIISCSAFAVRLICLLERWL